MDANSYQRISAPFRGHERALGRIDGALVVFVAASYVALIVWLIVMGDVRIWRVVLVPAISFVLMSVARALIDAPRPYEVLDIEPLIVKSTHGKSFPGRHVFSAGVTAMAFLYVSWPLSIPYLVATMVIGCVRVIGGVHFPRDVIAGAVLGVACGIIGFWII